MYFEIRISCNSIFIISDMDMQLNIIREVFKTIKRKGGSSY